MVTGTEQIVPTGSAQAVKTDEQQSELQRLAQRINGLHGNCQGLTATATRIGDSIIGLEDEKSAPDVPHEVRHGELGELENRIDDLERQIDCLTSALAIITNGLKV